MEANDTTGLEEDTENTNTAYHFYNDPRTVKCTGTVRRRGDKLELTGLSSE